MKRLHLEVYGRVQGVAFRAYTMRQARSLDLSGWVRNRRDGSVEILAEGEEQELRSLHQWCHTGSPSAEVERLQQQWLDFVGDVGPFSIRYS